MKKAVIIYKSKTGTTEELGKRIHLHLIKMGIDSRIISIEEIGDFDLSVFDYVFLGCWTSGLLLIMQKPERLWIEFVRKMPVLRAKNTVLFTTYKIRTGSMFRQMKKYLVFDDDSSYIVELKSRCRELSEKNQVLISNFLQNSY